MFAEILIIGMFAMGGGLNESSKVPRTELQRFVTFTERDELDRWVHWQERGWFVGHEAETAMGRGLLLFRDDLRTRGTVKPDTFEAVFGSDAAPNYCAISKAVIAAGFARDHGGSPDDYLAAVRKYSRCVATVAPLGEARAFPVVPRPESRENGG
jgi:hypothetical protein